MKENFVGGFYVPNRVLLILLARYSRFIGVYNYQILRRFFCLNFLGLMRECAMCRVEWRESEPSNQIIIIVANNFS